MGVSKQLNSTKQCNRTILLTPLIVKKVLNLSYKKIQESKQISTMSPTPKQYNWGSDTSQQASSSWSSSASNSASNGSSWCSSGDKNASSSSGWGGGGSTSGYSSSKASFVNVGSSNNNLPKFSDTFCNSGGDSSFKFGGSTSRQNSSENNLFGDPKKKLDWDGLVDNVFKEEIVKLSDTVRNKN